MALPAMVDSIEGLNEAVAKEYKKNETTGKYVLDVTPIGSFELSDTAGLKSALSKERTAAAELRALNKAFENLDPAAARDAIAKVEEMKTWTPSDKVAAQLEATKQDLLKGHIAEKSQLTGKVEKLTGALRKNLVTASLTQAIAEAKGKHKLLLPVAERFVRIREDGEEFKVEVVGEDGNVRVNGTGASMSIPEYIAELKSSDDYAPAFESSGASGTGATGGQQQQQQQQNAGKKKVISRNDRAAMNANIDGIAKGEVLVVN